MHREVSGGDFGLGSALALLPLLGPKPRLIGVGRDLGAKHDLVVTNDDFELNSRLIQAKTLADGDGERDLPAITDGNEGAQKFRISEFLTDARNVSPTSNGGTLAAF